ncbi:hypothetical protein E4U60_006009, partial [Claviceps pazoutovae]
MSFLHEHDHDHGHMHCHSNTQSHGAGEHSHQKNVHLDDDGMFPLADAGQGDIEAGRKFVKSRHYGHKHLSVTPARPGKDLGLFGVFVHVVGDAINNVGVIIAALIIWRTDSPSRYYADPAVGVFIAIMIFLTALPLTKSSGSILLQIAPDGIDLGDVKHDIEMIDGVHSVHELHIWRLNQQKSVATAHIVVHENIARNFTETAKIIMECLHAYGIHSATLQPEAIPPVAAHIQTASADSHILTVRDTEAHPSACQLTCSS